jgi:hypothetical protein
MQLHDMRTGCKTAMRNKDWGSSLLALSNA